MRSLLQKVVEEKLLVVCVCAGDVGVGEIAGDAIGEWRGEG